MCYYGIGNRRNQKRQAKEGIMFVLNVIFNCKPGKREEFLKLIKAYGIDAASREEDGCYRYDFFMSAEDPDDLFLLEFWRDADAQKVHTTAPHFAKLGELKKDYVTGQEVRRYFTDEEA